MHNGTIPLANAPVDYQRRGEGPPLLLIPGGAGHGGVFDPLTAHLAEHFDVVAASSRVVSAGRSGTPLGDQHPKIHAEDVRILVEELFDEPPLVFGSSSGAITAIELHAEHPDVVRLTVAHEPPLVGLLPDPGNHRSSLEAVRETARTQGVAAAMPLLAEAMSTADGPEAPELRHPGVWLDGYRDTRPEPPTAELIELFGRLGELQPAFLQHVLVPFATHEPDLHALSDTAQRFVPAAGIDSRGALPYRTTAALAARVGLPLTELPGGHLGPVERPAQFAAALTALLTSR